MHILELPSFFEPHGGLFCLEQAKALKSAGHEVRILACVQLGITIDREYYLTAPLTRRWSFKDGIECYISYMRGLPKLVKLNYIIWCKTVRSMYEDYRQKYGKPDVIHAHCAKWAGVAASLIAKEEKIPFYISEHLSSLLFEQDFGQEWNKEKWAKQLLVRTYHKANCVIPVSKELVYDLERFFGMDYHYEVLSNIIDTEFFQPAAKQPKREPFVFACAAVMMPGKGYDVLIKAFRIACKRSNKPMLLHIAGRGTDGKEMKQMITDDIKDQVLIHGDLDCEGVRQMLHASHCFVIATRSEAQGLVIMEALACGLPYISTDAIPQCLRLKNSAKIVPIDDADALAEAMIKTVDDCCLDSSIMQMRHKFIKDIASAETFATAFFAKVVGTHDG